MQGTRHLVSLSLCSKKSRLDDLLEFFLLKALFYTLESLIGK